MISTIRMFTVALLLALPLHGPAQAQEAGDDAQGEGAAVVGDGSDPAPGELSLGQPEGPQAGQTYIAEEHGDWAVRCVRSDDGDDPCQLYQLLRDEQGTATAEVSLFPLPEGQQAVAGATVITPLETLLTAQLRLGVDAGQAKVYPYSFCTEIGCFARIGFTAEDIDAFRRGAAATVIIVPAGAPDQEVRLTLSLSGFTAGWNAIRGQ